MKKLIREKLNEAFAYDLIENLMGEEYPIEFDLAHFKSLKNFSARARYCNEKLKRISSGSARIVYIIDDTKVLKLAKNKKGLAQNEIEISHSQYNDLSDILARLFDYDQNNLWSEMELARKVTPSIFKSVTGFSFQDFCAAVHNYGIDVHSTRNMYKMNVDKEIVAAMWENEFTYGIFDYIGNYTIPVGDLQRLNSYGLVKRNGQDAIVLIDYGLDNDVYSSYYS